jgi:hypothetical protein
VWSDAERYAIRANLFILFDAIDLMFFSTIRENVRAHAPTFLGGFFAVAALITMVAAFSLLAPDTPLDEIWRIKPREHQLLLAMGLLASIGFLLLAVSMALASIGCFLRRKWAWHLALVIFLANGVGDGIRIITGEPLPGLVGVLVVGLVIFWLTREGVRRSFMR